MSPPSLEEAVAQLPAFRSFADAVAQDTLQGRHVLLLTGGAMDDLVLRSGLDAALNRCRGPWLQPVFLTDHPADEPLAAFLARMTGILEEQLQPRVKRAEAEDGFQPVDSVLWMSGLESLPPAQAERWLEFFHLTARYGAAASHVLVLPLRRRPVSRVEAVSDTRLALYWWWDRISVLDMRLTCRLGEVAPTGSPEALWRESLLPHLACGDLTLATRLWEAVLQPEEVLMRALQECGRERGLEVTALREVLKRLGPLGHEPNQERVPPAAWLPLWEMGATQCSVEHGPELSVVALAMMEDLAELRARLWRGQAELMLPWLTRLRMAVCRILTKKHGRSWPMSFGKAWMDEEQQRLVSEDPLSTEFGPLEQILRKTEVGGQRFRPLIQEARLMRNLLAHNMVVSFGDFKSLWEQAQEILPLR